MLQSADGVDLTIGYHKLSGKSVKLKKPLVLVEKAQQTDDSGQALEYKVLLLEIACKSKHIHPQLAYDDWGCVQTVGVVRQKLLFKTRPKALISAPQQRR